MIVGSISHLFRYEVQVHVCQSCILRKSQSDWLPSHASDHMNPVASFFPHRHYPVCGSESSLRVVSYWSLQILDQCERDSAETRFDRGDYPVPALVHLGMQRCPIAREVVVYGVRSEAHLSLQAKNIPLVQWAVRHTAEPAFSRDIEGLNVSVEAPDSPDAKVPTVGSS